MPRLTANDLLNITLNNSGKFNLNVSFYIIDDKYIYFRLSLCSFTTNRRYCRTEGFANEQ